MKAPVSPSEGESLFERIGCNTCHSKGLITRGGAAINPYSDFLLHDMGDALADHDSVFAAGPREWRTAPLWGIGLAKKLNPDAGYLHDGRADSLEEVLTRHHRLHHRQLLRIVKLTQRTKGIGQCCLGVGNTFGVT